MQGRRSPEDVRQHPREVDPVARRIPAHVESVDLVTEQQREHGPDQVAEGGRAPGRRDEEARETGEEHDVHRGVEGADDVLGAAARAAHPRAHQEQPLQQGEAEREDRSIGERGTPVPASGRQHQEQQRDRDERVAGEIEHVGGRGHRRIHEQIGDHVADHEECVAGGEEQPGQSLLGPVQSDRVEDREHGGAAQPLVNDRLRRASGREREVDPDQRDAESQIDARRGHLSRVNLETDRALPLSR